MRSEQYARFFLMLSLLVYPGSKAICGPLDIEETHSEFTEFHDSYVSSLSEKEEAGSNHRDLFLPIQERFHHLFEGLAEVESLSDVDVEALYQLYRAAYTANFYRPDEFAAGLMKSVSAELQQRRLEPREDGEHPPMANHQILSYHALIDARLFETAKAFADQSGIDDEQRRSGLYDVEVEDAGSLSLLVPLETESGVEFEVGSLQLDTGAVVIAAVDSGCYFSEKAMDYLDENFGDIKEADVPVYFVTRQSNTGQGFSRIHAWNQDSEFINMRIAWKESEWPETIGFHTTPRFYFLKDGELKYVVNGWAGDEPHENFFEALKNL